jgi:ribose 5-phosphate isomerase B
MKIAIGSDAAGFSLKQHLTAHLKAAGHEVGDVGCFNTEPSDYPDFAREVGTLVRSGEVERGILICGTGQGMAISANKIRGIRAALAMETLPAFLSREHNDANVLCFGGWLVTPDQAKRVADVWLAAPFAGGVHQRRVEKIAGNEEV